MSGPSDDRLYAFLMQKAAEIPPTVRPRPTPKDDRSPEQIAEDFRKWAEDKLREFERGQWEEDAR
jgi:hypothetical protein